MQKQIAANALRFLERVDLKGSEVNAYLEVRQALVTELNQPEPPQAPEVPGVDSSAPESA